MGILKDITLKEAALFLKGVNNIGIVIHQYPDGDAIGSGYALCKALHALGKTARVLCDHTIPQKYVEIIEMPAEQDFTPEIYVSIDVATVQLMGQNFAPIAEKIDLCLDHHMSNTRFGQRNYVDDKAAAAAEIAYDLLCELDVTITRDIADCIYIGLCTDTGCFRYSNVTPKTHRVAAKMIEQGANFVLINKEMFDTKSKARIQMEQKALSDMEYYFDGLCALMIISKEMIQCTGAQESDLEGLTPIPRQIEGVLLGITLREKGNGEYKVSLRSGREINVSKICASLGGGGHYCAAGCTVSGPLGQAKKTVIEAVKPFVAEALAD